MQRAYFFNDRTFKLEHLKASAGKYQNKKKSKLVWRRNFLFKYKVQQKFKKLYLCGKNYTLLFVRNK